MANTSCCIHGGTYIGQKDNFYSECCHDTNTSAYRNTCATYGHRSENTANKHR